MRPAFIRDHGCPLGLRSLRQYGWDDLRYRGIWSVTCLAFDGRCEDGVSSNRLAARSDPASRVFQSQELLLRPQR